MGDEDEGDRRFADLPFHEYCAQCGKRFDETILKPTVTIVETEEERALRSFCDEECFDEWTSNGDEIVTSDR